MEIQTILDADLSESSTKQEIEIISVPKFIILSVLTLGIYEIWWMYKMWNFFKEKEEDSDIIPAARAIFSIFFLTGLLNRIKDYAHENGWSKSYSSAGLFVGFLIFSLTSRLPDPFWMIAILSFVFLIPPVNAFKYAIKNSNEFKAVERSGFSGRQIALIVVGIIFWAIIIAGLFLTEESYSY